MEENKQIKHNVIYQKVDFNSMSDRIFEIIGKSKSKIAQEDGWGLAIGYQIFTNYLTHITERAIELEDKIILFALNNIGVLADISKQEEEELQQAYSKWRKENSNKEGNNNE